MLKQENLLRNASPWGPSFDIAPNVENARGSESAVVFAMHLMDVAFAYLIEQCGAAFALDELMHSAKIRDALVREMARKDR